ncbi:hypothetical protein BjapCC829_19145 [Bradyrhizobium barranii]|uniref:Uncharacterized protein n=1 Tax=Bradyrhizobium barranii TaxID=2992140 RepID=A0ABY3QWV9_9BRAD|nr:hypothetical protein [Bradyrhizobium japonicum]UFW90531.1 hypothetical protein BjapCC829_19145 [Bradyrhizobium japonicum]
MLSIDFVRPFDKTYDLVTLRIRDRALGLTPIENAWLECLIREFQQERNKWDESKFTGYRNEWKRLRFNLSRLAAAAYLHISYDLPRVIADQWPGKSPWQMPPQMRATSIFFSLDRDFLDVFSIVTKDSAIVGLPAYFLSPFSRKLLRSSTHWVLLLRRAAWQHADQLRQSTNRRYVEERMLTAITLALKDVSDLPWSIGTLLPPDDAFAPAVVPVWLSELDHFWMGAASTLALGLMVAYLGRKRWKHYDELSDFIEELGLRTHEYVSIAIQDPEGLERCRLDRIRLDRSRRRA